MTETIVECLTPPGSAAIAVLNITGPTAWSIARKLFRPVSKRLPDEPMIGSTWFGLVSAAEGVGDEAILTVVPNDHSQQSVEIHCHGGRQVVRWLIESCIAAGCIERPRDSKVEATPWELLPHAKTLRTAGILLDQAHGAFKSALNEIDGQLERGFIAEALARLNLLTRYIPVGRHLVDPWRVAIVGAPNAGKSSLLNALTGYRRSVVAPIPGTTRDIVTALVAFDGWLVELSDTAGLRDSESELEQEGISRTRQRIDDADLCLWVVDASTAEAPYEEDWDSNAATRIVVLNKIDLPSACDPTQFANSVSISCATGVGLDELIRRITAALVPVAPEPGEAVPYSSQTCELLEKVNERLNARQANEAAELIRGFLRSASKPIG